MDRVHSCCECCDNNSQRSQRLPRVGPVHQGQRRWNRDVWMHEAVPVVSMKLTKLLDEGLIFDEVGVSGVWNALTSPQPECNSNHSAFHAVQEHVYGLD